MDPLVRSSYWGGGVLLEVFLRSSSTETFLWQPIFAVMLWKICIFYLNSCGRNREFAVSFSSRKEMSTDEVETCDAFPKQKNGGMKSISPHCFCLRYSSIKIFFKNLFFVICNLSLQFRTKRFWILFFDLSPFWRHQGNVTFYFVQARKIHGRE